MSRLTVPARESALAASQPLLDGVHKQLGSVPNPFRLIGPSPAAPGFARRVVETRGRVDEADLAAVRPAGYSEAQVVEIVASNIVTNYLGNIAETEIDFPVVRSAAVR